MTFTKKFSAWKSWAYDHGQYSLSDLSGFSIYPEIFEASLVQGTTSPTGLIYTDEFLFDFIEPLEHFLTWEGSHVP